MRVIVSPTFAVGLLLDKYPYNIKTSQEFKRVKCDLNNPENNEVSGFTQKLILTRNFSEKHYYVCR